MKLAVAMGLAGALAVLLGLACKPTPPTPAPLPTPAVIFSELVDAGCIADDDSGAEAIAEEHALEGGGFDWLNCLYDGGSVASCSVPCDAAAGVKRALRR